MMKLQEKIKGKSINRKRTGNKQMLI